MSLSACILKLAHSNPELREQLLGLVLAKSAASRKVRVETLGRTKWDVYDDGQGNYTYVTKSLSVVFTNPYTGEKKQRRYVFRISPDHPGSDKWRLDYYDMIMWVALTPKKYRDVEEAARAFASLDLSEVLAR